VLSSRKKMQLLQPGYVQNSYSQIHAVIKANKYHELKKMILADVIIDPSVMRKYLDWLIGMTIIQSQFCYQNEFFPIELKKSIFNFLNIHIITFNMFIEFFNYQLKKGTDCKIHLILQNFERYFTDYSSECATLKQYFKEQIFYNANGKLVKSLDKTFNYSKDVKYVNEHNLWRNVSMNRDENKLAFLIDHLYNDEKVAKNICRTYKNILEEIELNLIELETVAKKNNDEFVEQINKLLVKFQQICNQNATPTSSMLQIVALIVGLHNEIQHVIDSSIFTSAPAKLAQDIRDLLQRVVAKTPGFMKIIESSQNVISHSRSNSITLQVSDLFHVSDKIAMRFSR